MDKSDVRNAIVRLTSGSEKEREKAWVALLERIEAAQDTEALAQVGTAPLEDLLVNHGEEFIDRIEEAATRSVAFARALEGIWLLRVQPAIAERLGSLSAPDPVDAALNLGAKTREIAGADQPGTLALGEYFDYESRRARGQMDGLEAHPGAGVRGLIDKLTGAPDDSASAQALWFLTQDLVALASSPGDFEILGKGPLHTLVNDHSELLIQRLEEAALGSEKMRRSLQYVGITSQQPDHLMERLEALTRPEPG